MLLSKTLNRTRGHRTAPYGSITAPMHRSEKHTLHAALKNRLLVRQQLKTPVLTGHFWFSLFPSFLPPLHPAYMAEAPQGGGFPLSSVPQHQGQNGSALVCPCPLPQQTQARRMKIESGQICTVHTIAS